MGMFDSARDNALHLMTSEIGDWEGEVEAPTGSFSFRHYSADEIADVAVWHATSIRAAELTDANELVGFFLLQSDSNGLEYVTEFETFSEMVNAYRSLEREYATWGADDEDEEPFGNDSLGMDSPIAGMVDQFYIDMMEANRVEPYVHADYDRAERQWKAALLLFVKGDHVLADALVYHWHRSGEDIGYYAGRFSRQWLLDNS